MPLTALAGAVHEWFPPEGAAHLLRFARICAAMMAALMAAIGASKNVGGLWESGLVSSVDVRKRISRLRMVAQGLVGEPWATPAQVVGAMLCMQGQDWPGLQQSIAMRTAGRSIAQVREAFNAGQIVRSWPQRGTLHAMAAEDLVWYLKAIAQPRMASELDRRRIRLGLDVADVDAAREYAGQVLLERGSATREDLLGAMGERGIGDAPGQDYFLLQYLSVEGFVVQGPVDASGAQLFTLVEKWIAEPRRLDAEQAALEIVARYLKSHGPASRRDISRWSTLPLRTVDAAVEEVAGQLTYIDVDGERYWMHAEVAEAAESVSASRSLLLLPGFDELILGYGSRWMTVPSQHDGELVPGNNGMFRHSIVAGGQVIGLWKRGRSGPQIELFDEPSPALERRIGKAAARLPV